MTGTQEENERLSDKMKFFTKESAVDFAEIEQALTLIRSVRMPVDLGMAADSKLEVAA